MAAEMASMGIPMPLVQMMASMTDNLMGGVEDTLYKKMSDNYEVIASAVWAKLNKDSKGVCFVQYFIVVPQADTDPPSTPFSREIEPKLTFNSILMAWSFLCLPTLRQVKVHQEAAASLVLRNRTKRADLALASVVRRPRVHLRPLVFAGGVRLRPFALEGGVRLRPFFCCITIFLTGNPLRAPPP